MDYDFSALGTDGFERMAQALTVAELGNNVKPLGVGRDAGRDLYFRGPVNYRSASGLWDGYGIVQIKHRARDTDTSSNATWVKARIDEELRQWLPREHGRAPKRRDIPEYYLLVTGATLSPEGQDACLFHLQEICASLGMRGCDLWSRAETSRLLDNRDAIRRTYLHLILPGDIVAAMQSSYGEREVDLAKQLCVGAAVDLTDRQWARLGDSGLESEERLKLTSVAVDLPCSPLEEEEGEAENPESVLQRAIDLGDRNLSPSYGSKTRGILLKGGPGQGKSTIAQLLCQLYRTAFVQDSSALLSKQRDLIEQVQDARDRLGLAAPRRRRWPAYVDLSKFGDFLAEDDQRSLMGFIATQLRVQGEAIKPHQLQSWRKAWPWAVVLDGLDEVAHPTIRDRVGRAIDEFLTDSQVNDADVLLFATTRPQGYHGELGGFNLQELELDPLSPQEALAYGELVARYRYEDDTLARDRVIERLRVAASSDLTSKLMTTPLQVTIMSMLMERASRVPETRHALFDAYYRAIYSREQVKASTLGAILTKYQPVVDYLHEQVALFLHSEAERPGRAEALIRSESMTPLIVSRLEQDGHDRSDAERLAREIVRAVRNRVVLLVGIRDDLVGYEVRSLQEYFAARSLATGAEQSILRRLSSIIPRSHWRNVLLLAAGRLEHHSNPQILDSLLLLGTQADVASLLTLEVRPGQRFALDLLDDGFAANIPRIRRMLLATVLGMFNHWPDLRVTRLTTVLAGEIESDRTSYTIVQQASERALATEGAARAAACAVLMPWRTSRGTTGTLANYVLGKAPNWRIPDAPPRTVADAGVRLRGLFDASGLSADQVRRLENMLSSFREATFHTDQHAATLGQYLRRRPDVSVGNLGEVLEDDELLRRLIELLSSISEGDGELAISLREHLIALSENEPTPQSDLLDAEVIGLLHAGNMISP
ncbi:NACHT domain-containing protein [Microbacterium keratanolyticum]